MASALALHYTDDDPGGRHWWARVGSLTVGCNVGIEIDCEPLETYSNMME